MYLRIDKVENVHEVVVVDDKVGQVREGGKDDPDGGIHGALGKLAAKRGCKQLL